MWTRRTKYRNVPVVVDGIRFDSKKEAQWFMQLRVRERIGEVRNIRRQVRFPLMVNGVKVGSYVADGVYEERVFDAWKTVIADVKSPVSRANRVYRLKAKIMAANGHPITEIL